MAIFKGNGARQGTDEKRNHLGPPGGHLPLLVDAHGPSEEIKSRTQQQLFAFARCQSAHSWPFRDKSQPAVWPGESPHSLMVAQRSLKTSLLWSPFWRGGDLGGRAFAPWPVLPASWLSPVTPALCCFCASLWGFRTPSAHPTTRPRRPLFLI